MLLIGGYYEEIQNGQKEILNDVYPSFYFDNQWGEILSGV